MRRRYQIKYEPLALQALEESATYIQEQSGPGRAEAWLRALLDSIDNLETLPKAFGICAHRQGRPIFSKLVPPYRVFYLVEDETDIVHIIDLVHTSRETKLVEYRDSPQSDS